MQQRLVKHYGMETEDDLMEQKIGHESSAKC